MNFLAAHSYAVFKKLHSFTLRLQKFARNYSNCIALNLSTTVFIEKRTKLVILTRIGPIFFVKVSALLGGGFTMGFVFLEAENFFLFFFNKAKPWAIPCSSRSTCWSGTSRLGFESLRLTEPFSSDAGLLLWLPCSFSRQLLQTESSDRDLPMRRETFPVFAASMSVPQRRLWEWVRFNSLKEQNYVNWQSINISS